MNIGIRERQLYDSIAVGWNTWDVASVTAHVLLPQRLRVNVAVIIPGRNAYSRNCTWDMVEEFGEHSLDGTYTCITIKYMERRWRIETSAEGEELIIKVTPLTKNLRAYIALEVSNIWGGVNTVCYGDEGILVSCPALAGEKFTEGNRVENKYVVKTLNSIAALPWNPSYQHTIAVKDDEAVYFAINSQKATAEIDQALTEAKERWLNSTIRSEGDMGEGLCALRRVLLWNLVYESRHDRPVTPVTRFWCTEPTTSFGDYALFVWDTFFASLLYGLFSRELAYATFFSILDEISPEGAVPNVGGATGPTSGRSQPQVGSFCAWKLYLQHGDKWFLEESFDRLLAWNRWRFKNRDFNGDGLLELACLPYEADYDHSRRYGILPDDAKDGEMDSEWITCGAIGPMFESGLDNSPMWDRAVYNKELHCMELSYVGLNSLMVMDCRLLAKIGREIGAEETVIRELENQAEILAGKIHSQLWCEEKGSYLNKHWSGEFDPAMSPTHFYAWMTENVNPDRGEKMLAHMLNEEEFWGDLVIPMIAKNDPSFAEQKYWRGRIWAPTNYLTGEALLAGGYREVWQELTKKGYDMFVRCWKEKGYVGENYNAITGQASEKGDILWFSDKFYHWGALLVYMAVQTVLDFNVWEDEVKQFERPTWMEPIRGILRGNERVDID